MEVFLTILNEYGPYIALIAVFCYFIFYMYKENQKQSTENTKALKDIIDSNKDTLNKVTTTNQELSKANAILLDTNQKYVNYLQTDMAVVKNDINDVKSMMLTKI